MAGAKVSFVLLCFARSCLFSAFLLSIPPSRLLLPFEKLMVFSFSPQVVLDSSNKVYRTTPFNTPLVERGYPVPSSGRSLIRVPPILADPTEGSIARLLPSPAISPL